jgi:predicted secreted protein
MPGLSIPGRLAKLEVSQDNGATFENFGHIVDVSMPISVDELETTSHDTVGSREYLPSFMDITMDVNARWADGDPGQEIVTMALFAKSTFQFKFYMEIAGGRKRFEGSAFATSYNPSGPLDDTAGLAVTLRCSGVVMANQ